MSDYNEADMNNGEVKTSQKKIALIIAALTILLCFVILTGSTLALFTSTNDGKIGINATAGNIEVDIIDASKNPESLVGSVLNFVTTSQNQEIYFEPGATYYTEGFRVKNTGEIPLNFIVYISEDVEEKYEGIAFEDAFDVWLTKKPLDKNGMEKMPNFKGSLAVGETSDVYYLVFRMKETAGNEFQGKTFTGIGITVCAVQGNAVVD